MISEPYRGRQDRIRRLCGSARGCMFFAPRDMFGRPCAGGACQAKAAPADAVESGQECALDELELREVTTITDIHACLRLQKETWGMPDVEMTGAKFFVIAKHAGTPALGAFDRTGRLVGYLYTFLGRFHGTMAYYSHQLAVAGGWQDKGVGHRLKLAQRERALREGIDLVVWTFDPLQSRNAHLNLNKLGAVVRRYVVNFYGEQNKTIFDAGIGSDRVFAEWWVRSPRVEMALRGERFRPAILTSGLEIPSDINAVKEHDERAALLWRLHTRERFTSRLSRGLVAVGLDHDKATDRSRYVFADAREVQLAN
jgi:predicted GNAT superfamily acetyltransferase